VIRLHPKARAGRGFSVSGIEVMIVFASDLHVDARAAPSVTVDDGWSLRVGAAFAVGSRRRAFVGPAQQTRRFGEHRTRSRVNRDPR
jgi:hypothetical protein